jgi:excisionase family DNA binding protein
MEELTIPTVGDDYCTYGWAAEHLGVSTRTISRLVKAGKLRRLKARGGQRESGNGHGYLYTAEVKAYRLALRLVRP